MLALYARYQMAKDSIKKYLKSEEEGQTIVEYVLLIVLIALAVAVAQPNITNAIRNVFNATVNSLAVPT